MLPATSGWINHAEALLFCLSAGEKFDYRMQHFSYKSHTYFTSYLHFAIIFSLFCKASEPHKPLKS